MFAVALEKCGSYERARVFDAVARAVDRLGGMSRFVRPGARVLVKPNLVFPRPKEAAVTTHPEVVRAVVELAAQAGASETLVGDSPALASTASVAKACGLVEALVGTSARFVEFDASAEAKGSVFPKLVLAEPAVESDCVVNLAKAKTHVQAGLTLAAKNCFGCVPGLAKSQWHLRAGRDGGLFARLLADVARTVGPGLNIVDAIVAMEGNGPGSGTPRMLGALVAGENPFAVDVAAARLLGFGRDELPLERAAVEMEAGPRGMDEIELLGEAFKFPAVDHFTRALGRHTRFSLRLPGFMVRALRRHATPRRSETGELREPVLSVSLQNRPPPSQ